MANTILQVSKNLAARIGLPQPTSIINGDGDLPPQYQMLMLEAAADLMRRHDWQFQNVEAEFTTLGAATQFAIYTAYPDYKRLHADSVVNLTRGLRMKHISRAQAVALKLTPSPAVQGIYRIISGSFTMPGNTTAGDTVNFEYLSSGWLMPAAPGPRKITPTIDTDVVLLDEEALILGTKWRFKKENGLAYGEDFNDFERYVQDLIGGDTPKDPLSLNTPAVSAGLGSMYGAISIPA